MSENAETTERMLERVATLVKQADEFRRHGEDGSADAALARADAIMTKYAIDRAMIEARISDRDSVKREKPASVTIPFVRYDIDFYNEYRSMLGSIARHCRVRVRIKPSYTKSEAVLVGFPTDVQYMQMLWNSVYFTFVSKLDPTWDPARTAEENIKILKESGRKWAYIGHFANENGFENKPNDGRLKAAYRRQCRLEGVEPTSHTQRHEAYRAAYAEGFEAEISTRLFRLQQAMKQQVAETTGADLVLRDRMQDVHEAYYEIFPDARPATAEERAKRDAEFEKLRHEDLAAEEARRARMTPEQRAEEDRKAAAAARREERRWQREQARRQDDAGRKAGQTAASTVDLGAAKVDREKRTEIGS